MAKLVNTQTLEIEDVSNDRVEDVIQSGSHTFIKDDEVTVLDPEGRLGKTTGEAAYELLSDPTTGYRFKTEQEYKLDQQRMEHGGLGGIAQTAAEGFSRGATLGLSDVLLTKTGLVDAKDMRARRDVNPITSTSSEVVGAILPTPAKAPGILKIAGTPVRVVDKTGRGVQKLTEAAIKTRKASIGKSAASLGARGAVEGALFSAGTAVSEAALGDKQLNGEILATHIANGFTFGGAVGSVMGGGGAAAQKTARALKEKVGKEMEKFAGLKLSDANRRLNIKPTDLKMEDAANVTGRRSVVLQLDPDTTSYFYTDGVKRIDVSPEQMDAVIISPQNQEIVDEIGAITGVTDLWERTTNKYEPGGNKTFREFLLGEVQDAYIEATGAQAGKLNKVSKALKTSRSGLQRMQKKALELRQEVASGKLSKKEPLKKAQKKVNDLMKGYKKAKSDYDTEFKKLTGLKGEQAKKAVDSVDDIFRNADGVVIGKRLYINNPKVLQESMVGAKNLKAFNADKQTLSTSESAALKFAGAAKRDFTQKPVSRQKELSEFIKDNFRDVYSGKLINHPMLTKTDELYENIMSKQADSIVEIDTAIDAAENYLYENGLDIGINGQMIKNKIYRDYVTPYKSASGKIDPTVEDLVKKAREYGDKMADFTRDVRPDGSMGQRSFGLRELRQIRQNIDRLVNYDRKNMSVEQEMFVDVRNYIEDQIIGKLKKFDNVAEIRERYIRGKKTFSLSKDAMKMIQDKMSKEQANVRIGLGDYGFAISGGAMGGVMGAAAMMATRKFGTEYGNQIIALYGDKILKDRQTVSKTISRAVSKAFSGKHGVAIKVSTIPMVQYSEEDYQKDLKRINSGQMSHEALNAQFQENNKALLATHPDIAMSVQETMLNAQNFLLEKFPKTSYEAPGYKYTPTKQNLQKFARYKQVIANPNVFFKQLESGYVTGEAIEVMRQIYPKLYFVSKAEVIERASQKDLTYQQKSLLKKVYGIESYYFQKPRAVEMNAQMRDPELKEGNEAAPQEFNSGEQSRAGSRKRNQNSATHAQGMMREY